MSTSKKAATGRLINSFEIRSEKRLEESLSPLAVEGACPALASVSSRELTSTIPYPLVAKFPVGKSSMRVRLRCSKVSAGDDWSGARERRMARVASPTGFEDRQSSMARFHPVHRLSGPCLPQDAA